MRDSKPAVAARLQLLRQAAREDAERDIAFVLDWHPGPECRRVDEDLMFVIGQVLTVAEDPACRRRAGS
jgi:hypothetical protein